ncbi:MAG: Abi family protein [Ferrovum myxofaciens]
MNYYRLRAYWLPFETTLPGGEHQFRTGTTFSDVIGIYQFDRALRLLLLDAIERIEISLCVRAGQITFSQLWRICPPRRAGFPETGYMANAAAMS